MGIPSNKPEPMCSDRSQERLSICLRSRRQDSLSQQTWTMQTHFLSRLSELRVGSQVRTQIRDPWSFRCVVVVFLDAVLFTPPKPVV
jgi:hypothetical protein